MRKKPDGRAFRMGRVRRTRLLQTDGGEVAAGDVGAFHGRQALARPILLDDDPAGAGLFGSRPCGIPAERLAGWMSPWRALFDAMGPDAPADGAGIPARLAAILSPVAGYLAASEAIRVITGFDPSGRRRGE